MGTSRVRGIVLVAGVAAFLVAVALTPSAARADMEFDIGLGYSHVELDGSVSPFDSRDGFRIEPRFSWTPGGDHSPLRLGVGLGISGFDRRTDDDDIIIDDDGDIFVVDSDDVESLTLITPEFQVSYRLLLGPGDDEGNKHWFIEPGVAVGVVVGQYWVGDTFGWWVDTDVSEWDVTIAGRPFLRAGYQGDRWVFGLEGSYLFGGSLEFTNQVEGDLTEWYGGAFVGGRW